MHRLILAACLALVAVIDTSGQVIVRAPQCGTLSTPFIRVPCAADAGASAIQLVASTAKAASTFTGSVTTDPITTTGASLIVVGQHYAGDHTQGPGAPTDSKGNTYTCLTRRTGPSDFNTYSHVRLCYVASPTVGTGHTVTETRVSGAGHSVTVAAFSGTATVSAFDVQNGAHATGNTALSSGPVTPSLAGALVVSVLTVDNGTSPAVSGGALAIERQVARVAFVNVGAALAYEVQTTATARSAAWTWTTTTSAAAAIAAFKPVTADAPAQETPSP